MALVIFLFFVYFSPGIIFPKLHMTDSKIAQLCLSHCFLWGERWCPSHCRASLNLSSAQTSLDLDVDPRLWLDFQSAANEQERETEDTMMDKVSIDILGQDERVRVCWKHWSDIWCDLFFKLYEYRQSAKLLVLVTWITLNHTCRSLIQLLSQGKPAQVWMVVHFHIIHFFPLSWTNEWKINPLCEKHRNNILQGSINVST